MHPLSDGVRHWVPHNRWDLVAPSQLEPVRAKVAVIMPYFEQPESLRRMYAALAVADLDPRRTDVVIVDDGSAVAPPRPPTDWPLTATVLHQANEGCRPGAARNLGADSTDAEILVFLDPDTLPEPSTVARLAAWPATLPDALVVGWRGHVDLTGFDVAQTLGWLSGAPAASRPPRRADPAWLADGYHASNNLLDADARSFRYVISAVMACHRSLFDDIGGFDGDRSNYGGEDWEFAARAFANGAVLAHDPAARAWHDEPDWSARDRHEGGDGEQDEDPKAEETMWLAAHIGEPATRGPSLRQRFADTVVRLELPAATSAAAVTATIQTVLTELPDVFVHLVAPVSELVATHVAHDARVRLDPPDVVEQRLARTMITLRAPIEARSGSVRRLAAASVGAGGPGRVDVIDGGRSVATVISNRAVGRARRAQWFGFDPDVVIEALFGTHTVDASVAGLRVLPDDLDLAAWLAATRRCG